MGAPLPCLMERQNNENFHAKAQFSGVLCSKSYENSVMMNTHVSKRSMVNTGYGKEISKRSKKSFNMHVNDRATKNKWSEGRKKRLSELAYREDVCTE